MPMDMQRKHINNIKALERILQKNGQNKHLHNWKLNYGLQPQ